MAKHIKLSRGYVAVVDDADYEWLIKTNWWVLTSVRSTSIYAMTNPIRPGQSGLMHRQILPGFDWIDHRDGDGLNNRRSNLRPATRNQNAQNRRIQVNNSTGFVGVYVAPSGRWLARIQVNNKSICLGTFTDPIEAARVRDAAAVELHGEFARLNFPTTEGEPAA